jgi:hypothetical protein
MVGSDMSRRLLQGIALAALVQLLSACASGPPGSTMTMTECMDPALASSRDVRRNLSRIKRAPICYRRQQVREGAFRWTFHILEHRNRPDGPFWVLPHDNEDSAFDVAVQAVIDYGGGLLAVESGGRRMFLGQDPNRNFSRTRAESALCRGQRLPAPGYTDAVLGHYRGRSGPILAVHNNHDGWNGNGGRGTISMHRRTRSLSSYYGRGTGALRDEDNLVFMAGLRPLAAEPHTRQRVAALNAAGLNVIYKQVDNRSFDCSLSDYVARHRLGEYYNVEAQHGASRVQKEMIERLFKAIGIRTLRTGPTSPFLDI